MQLAARYALAVLFIIHPLGNPMTELPVLRSIDLERDAEKLAQMWNASDSQWPGTWNCGVPCTADWIKSGIGREEYRDYLVWDAGDRIGGSCSLRDDTDEDDVIYLPLLNVAPGFQKQSLGRRVLVEAVRKVVEWKKYRLDLDTWSGNLKAVPLYKKCGFFWMPGPHVKMLNFTPAILQMPCTAAFFEKHDWYTAFRRELTQVPDDERWEGLGVFTYRYEAGDERLVVRVDRETRRVTAIDTPDFFVAATVDNPSPVRGGDVILRWQIVNRRHEPMALSLIAQATGDLSIDYREETTVGPDETRIFESKVVVSDTAGASDPDGPAPRVITRLLIGQTPVELGTGIRPRLPITMSAHPEYITLMPGVPQTVHLRLRSFLSHDTDITLGLSPSEGLTVDRPEHIVTLPAGGHAGTSVTLTTDRGGRFDWAVSGRFVAEGKNVSLPAESRTVFALPPGGLLSLQSPGEIRIENERLRAVIKAKAGELTLSDLATGESLLVFGGRPIPPQWPSEYRKADFTLALDREGETAVVTAFSVSKKSPGFVFRKTIRISAGAMIEVEHSFENTGLDPYVFRLYQFALNPHPGLSTLTLPLKKGLVRERCADFPGPHDTAFERSGVYAETWGAYEYPHGTIGLFWPDDGEEISWSWNEMGFISREFRCPPGSRIALTKMRLYVGDGGWTSVRRVWRRLTGIATIPYQAHPAPMGGLDVDLEPSTPVVTTQPVVATLRVKHFLSRPVSGVATLELPDGWTGDHTRWTFENVHYHAPFATELRLSTVAPPGAYTGNLVLKGGECDVQRPVSLIRFGDASPVAVSSAERQGHLVYTIANGRFEIDVTPSFCGSVSAIRDDRGVDHLASAFPEAETFNWLHPWYGGIVPIIDSGLEMTPPGLAPLERFAAEPITATDTHGIVWTGVRQRATLEHEELRGLTLEMDTLTVGGSPAVWLVWRFYNQTSALRRIRAGWSVFVQPDGDRSRTTLFTDGYERKRSRRTFGGHGGGWVGSENPETGRVVALISSTPQVEIDDWGDTGGHLQLRPTHTIAPSGEVAMSAYFVIADSREETAAWAALSAYPKTTF